MTVSTPRGRADLPSPDRRRNPDRPSTYYAAKTRPPSARSVSDAATSALIGQMHKDNYGVYGARKVHAEIRRQGHSDARCTVDGLIRQAAARH